MPQQLTMELIAAFCGIAVISVIAGVLLVVLYPNTKIIIADILRLLGFLGKCVRKKSVEHEIEGTINSFIKYFMSDLSIPLLPECEVQWVTQDNVENVIQEGKAIICVSFSKGNHELNYYNATYAFMQTGLLRNAKPFIKKTTGKAIDLLMTKISLMHSNRKSLRIFNEKFREEGPDCKEIFYKLEETEERGLFRRILLHEYYFFGEIIGDKTPKQEYETEAESFLEWFYNLAIREEGEKTTLAFESDHIKIGVILVARAETQNKYGIDAYVRRANRYAANDYKCIYICSRGSDRGSLSMEIAKTLCSTGCFENLTKKPDFIKFDNDGRRFVVTCIALKPSLTTIIQQAWERVTNYYETGKLLLVSVQIATKNSIIVDAYGLRVEIPLDMLSSMRIADATKYFERDQDLLVKILEIDPKINRLVLSNVDTDTDPKKILEQVKVTVDEIVRCTVEKIIQSDGVESGIIIRITNSEFQGYIPRSKATFSRFIHLGEKFPVGSEVAVHFLNFNFEYARFTCAVSGLDDPWKNISGYSIDDRISATVRLICERYFICELSEGVEGKVSASELSWDTFENNVDKIRNIKVGEIIKAKIININEVMRSISLSIKQLTVNPVDLYFVNHRDSLLEVDIGEVRAKGAVVTFPGTSIRGFLPISEVSWSYCADITRHIKTSDKVKVRLIEYNSSYDNVIVSIKQVVQNNYEIIKTTCKEGDVVRGVVHSLQPDRATIMVEFADNLTVHGYVHKSELSNVLFVDERLLPKLLTLGKTFSFIIKRFDDRARIVELSRRQYFHKALSSLRYGEKYSVNVVMIDQKKYYAFSDEMESILSEGVDKIRVTSGIIGVIVARIDYSRKGVEISLM